MNHALSSTKRNSGYMIYPFYGHGNYYQWYRNLRYPLKTSRLNYKPRNIKGSLFFSSKDTKLHEIYHLSKKGRSYLVHCFKKAKTKKSHFFFVFYCTIWFLLLWSIIKNTKTWSYLFLLATLLSNELYLVILCRQVICYVL